MRALLLGLLMACGGYDASGGFADPSREYAEPVVDVEPLADVVHQPDPMGVWHAALSDDPDLPKQASCSTCHGPDPQNFSPGRSGEAFHTKVEVQHGEFSCNSCHDLDRTKLHLADGTTFDFSEVQRLCAQCHGPQNRDFEHGVHGGAAGYWDTRRGVRTRNNCVDCHAAHAPAIAQVMPASPPRDRFLGAPPLRIGGSARAPEALSFLEKRAARQGSGDVATQCIDCHDARRSHAGRGQRVEHPIDLPLPDGADLAGLQATGARTGTDESGRATLICRSCHQPHDADTKPRLVSSADDGTLFRSCHADHRGGPNQHPVSGADLTCTTCHSVHGAASGSLLVTTRSGPGACADCHTSVAHALEGRGHGGTFCTDCHGMHEPPAHVGRAPAAAEPEAQTCANCHQSGAPKAQVSSGVGHLKWSPSTGCRDCHLAHGNQPGLPVEAGITETCVSCHEAVGSVVGSKHDPNVTSAMAGTDSCLSCHDVHGATTRPTVPAGVNPASWRCLSCHDGRTDARSIARWSHPAGLLLTTSGLPFRYDGAVPYFSSDGQRTADRAVGEITCASCHDPHKWKHGGNGGGGDVEGSEQDSFLRDPNDVVMFCSVCHGVDGRPRFRFFHEDRWSGDPATP